MYKKIVRVIQTILSLFCLSYIHGSENEVNFIVLKNHEIITYFDKISKVGLQVLREYPYFFEGTFSDYIPYLKLCSDSKYGLAILAELNGEIIGILWGTSISDYTEDLVELFINKEINPVTTFYIAGFSLLPEYRKKGIGYNLYKKFESQIIEFGEHIRIAYCEVIQSPHAVKPNNYTIIDPHAEKAGFVKYKELECHWSWKEIGEDKESEHSLVFWVKEL